MTSGPPSTTPDGNPDNQPLWRQHFPIDTCRDAARSRREFVGSLVVAGTAIAGGQAALNAVMSPADRTVEFQPEEPLQIDCRLSDMKDGEAFQFHYPDHRSPCLLVKLDADRFVAFSQKCTHLACPVIPMPEHREFHCPCHHGVFDLETGEPKAGPPRTALLRIRIETSNDGTLTATGIENV